MQTINRCFDNIKKLEEDIVPLNQDNKWIEHALVYLERCTNALHLAGGMSRQTMDLARFSGYAPAIEQAENIRNHIEYSCAPIYEGYEMLTTTEPFTRQMLSKVREKAKEADVFIKAAFRCERKMLTIIRSIHYEA